MATNAGGKSPAFDLGPQGTKPAGGKPKMINPAPGGGKTTKVSAGKMMKAK